MTARAARPRGTIKVAALANLIVALSISGCATASTRAASGRPHDGPTYTGPVLVPISYEVAGITLEPPSSNVPHVSWEAAYAACKTDCGAWDPGGAAAVSLADATTTGSGAMEPDGTFKPLADSRLAYVITFRNVLCSSSGGPVSLSPKPPPSPQRCTILNLVGAQTGDVILSTEFSIAE